MTSCNVCFHKCKLNEGQIGLCKTRECKDGTIISRNYGRLSSIALDPIEKKPIARFMSGSFVLSIGSFGCNLSCPFCQNYEISQNDDVPTRIVMPDELLDMAGAENTEASVDEALLSQHINTFLSGLEKQSRMIFVRRYFYVDSLAQIADAYSMSESAVKSQLFRIRQKLKEHLEKEGYET